MTDVTPTPHTHRRGTSSTQGGFRWWRCAELETDGHLCMSWEDSATPGWTSAPFPQRRKPAPKPAAPEVPADDGEESIDAPFLVAATYRRSDGRTRATIRFALSLSPRDKLIALDALDSVDLRD